MMDTLDVISKYIYIDRYSILEVIAHATQQTPNGDDIVGIYIFKPIDSSIVYCVFSKTMCNNMSLL